MHNVTPVDDTLLKKLSIETQLVGKQAIVKAWDQEPEYQAIIVNVIILPLSVFYRNQFMTYYADHNKNAVKALKELEINYPNTKDYDLNIGYVLSTGSGNSVSPLSNIRNRSDFMLPEELSARRQDVFKKSKGAIKTSFHFKK